MSAVACLLLAPADASAGLAGTPDPAYGAGTGLVSVAETGADVVPVAALAAPGGSVYLALRIETDLGNSVRIVKRLAHGNPDPAFGGDGAKDLGPGVLGRVTDAGQRPAARPHELRAARGRGPTATARRSSRRCGGR